MSYVHGLLLTIITWWTIWCMLIWWNKTSGFGVHIGWNRINCSKKGKRHIPVHQEQQWHHSFQSHLTLLQSQNHVNGQSLCRKLPELVPPCHVRWKSAPGDHYPHPMASYQHKFWSQVQMHEEGAQAELLLEQPC